VKAQEGTAVAASYAQAKAQVGQLVTKFSQLSAHNRKGYNEAATRQEFILPLFHALGWDTEDTREVSPEEQVSRGYVDFSVRLQGIPRFFLETKRIPADLEDPRWARQAINYAWLKGVTWAVLTDFEGLKVFNAEWQETVPARAIFKNLHWQAAIPLRWPGRRGAARWHGSYGGGDAATQEGSRPGGGA
jgi:hypothetical protein